MKLLGAGFLQVSSAIAITMALMTLPAVCQEVTGDYDSGYHIRVITRSTQAVDYRKTGSTHVDLRGTGRGRPASVDEEAVGVLDRCSGGGLGHGGSPWVGWANVFCPPGYGVAKALSSGVPLPSQKVARQRSAVR